MVAHLNHGDQTPVYASRRERVTDNILFVMGGGAFAAFAMIVNLALDGFAIAIAQRTMMIRDVCLDGFNDVTVAAVIATTISTSILVGVWAYNCRLAIGIHPEPGREERSELMRRRFIQSALGFSILATPFKLLLMLSASYCFAGGPA